MGKQLTKKELEILEDLKQDGVTLEIGVNSLVVFADGEENYYTISQNNAEHIMDTGMMAHVRNYGRGKDKVSVYRLERKE